VLPDQLIDEDLKDGRLVTLFPSARPTEVRVDVVARRKR
jgi:hypothetical protein